MMATEEISLYVFYVKEKFPEYMELLEKLEGIPDVIIIGMNVDSILDDRAMVLIEGKGLSIVYYPHKVEVYDHTFEKKYAEANVSDNEQAISRIIFYTGYYLKQVTGDEKFLKKRKIDRNRIEFEEASVYEVNDPKVLEKYGVNVAKAENCIFKSVYFFTLSYIRGYRSKFVEGYLVCCEHLWYAVIIRDREYGYFNMIWEIIIINPKGKQCVTGDIVEKLSDKTLIRVIDEYVMNAISPKSSQG